MGWNSAMGILIVILITFLLMSFIPPIEVKSIIRPIPDLPGISNQSSTPPLSSLGADDLSDLRNAFSRLNQSLMNSFNVLPNENDTMVKLCNPSAVVAYYYGEDPAAPLPSPPDLPPSPPALDSEKQRIALRCLQLWNNIAVDLSEAGKNQEALKYLDAILQINSTDAVALSNRAAVLIELGNLTEGEQSAHRATERVDSQIHVSLQDNSPGEPQQVVYGGSRSAYLTSELHLADRSMEPSGIYLEQEMPVKKKDWLGHHGNFYTIAREAISLGGDVVKTKLVANNNRGIALFLVGDIEGAKKIFIAILRVDEKNVPSNYYYGLYLNRTAGPEEAAKYINTACEEDPYYDGSPIQLRFGNLAPEEAAKSINPACEKGL
jgi:tetratricopeptide (TPR) repeat protein